MSSTLLILSICLYIFSMMASLLLGMASKKFSEKAIRIPLLFHVILLLITLFLTLSDHSSCTYFMLFSFCSATLLSIWILRKKTSSLPLKIYFSLPLFSILLFIYSPGRLMHIITGNNNVYREEIKIDLSDNYFLIEQRNLFSAAQDSSKYKLIKQSGFYKKTLARDIFVDDSIVSGKLIKYDEDTAIVELFFENDSVGRVGLKPGMKSKGIKKGKE